MTRCPIERRFEVICESAGIAYERDDERSGLDFYLPDHDVFVEVKQFHSVRIAGQMARKLNVIAIQGVGAMEAFAKMLAPRIDERRIIRHDVDGMEERAEG